LTPTTTWRYFRRNEDDTKTLFGHQDIVVNQKSA
jgi:hypothetical protein